MKTTPKTPAPPRTEADLIRMLGERYCAPAWAFLPHVRNGTGWSRAQTRTADGIAMSLYPSRGLGLHGFEVKCRRYDWVRELENPAKADEIAAFVDYWWIVAADDTIVVDGELPDTWGLLVPTKGALVQKREPKRLHDPKPIDRPLLAAILRKTQEAIGPAAETKKAVEKAVAAERERQTDRRDYQQQELDELKKRIAEFEGVSGVRIERWGGKNIAEAVRIVLAGKDMDVRHRLENFRRTCETLIEDCDQALGRLDTKAGAAAG